MLKEIFDDQASIAGRHFKKFPNIRKAHSELQGEIIGKGVYVDDMASLYWNPRTFEMFLPDFEHQKILWQSWKESNIAFCRYWTGLFGALNKNWQPPL